MCDKHEPHLMVVDVNMSIFLLLILTHLLSVRSFGMMQIRISDLRSLGSWYTKMNWSILSQSGFVSYRPNETHSKQLSYVKHT